MMTIKKEVEGISVTIELTEQDVQNIIREYESNNILEDVLSIIHERNKISNFDENLIRSDKNLIYSAFEHEEDSNLSHWENIERAIRYMEQYDLPFDYSKLKI